eukprot:383213_1
MSIEQKNNTYPPTNIDGLIYWMKKLHVRNDYIERFVEKFKNWDWIDIKQDINDYPSIITNFFKHSLQAEHIYYDVKDIINGRLNTNIISVQDIFNDGLNNSIIDAFLVIYYESRGRNDYYDYNGDGKFTIFLNDNDIDSDSMIEELNEQLDTKEYQLIKLGMNDYGYFPNEMYYVMKFCFKHKQIPTQITIHNLVENIVSNERIINWERIGNAIHHELYENISHEFMQIIHNNKYKTIKEILNALKNKVKMDDNEIKYMKQLIKR